MKKYILILTIVIFNNFLFSHGQQDSYEANRIPQEKIYVHYNTSLLFNGENIYYKVYCLNADTNKTSNISKIAYIELISSDKKSVFKHKVNLKSGVGQGDFFIPVSVLSGNYKLIAYTQWMRNAGENNLFQADISIINTFQSNQDIILNSNDTLIPSFSASITNNNSKDRIKTANQHLSLRLNKKSFKQREKVSLTLINFDNSTLFGNYSISVKKIYPLKTVEKITSESYTDLNRNSNIDQISTKNTPSFLPELRGNLISGNVIYKATQTRAHNIKIGLSIPGEQYLFKVANTNDKGVFYFNIDENYNNNTYANFQIIGDEKEKFQIIINEQKPIDYNHLTFNSFKINFDLKDIILQRSIYNQIENAYATYKQDSIIETSLKIPFYSELAEEYLLDDYTRFPTIRETVVEIIKDVSINKNGDTYDFNLKGYNYNRSNLPTLILVDGLLVEDHGSLIDFDARTIKKISVVRDKYIYSSKLFQGVISMETINNDYYKNKNRSSEDYIKNIKLLKPVAYKKYFNQVYADNDAQNRIPDYRSQLFWEPNLNLNKEDTQLTFFTSDNTGHYEICIEGFTKNGVPITIRDIITVE
ncbi:hypothetical protein D7030_01945 [Flavobacteriaceae bacterium AU392]|nr:hypothetical protein D7030_01945 [Flavobacteriaceae bacterium AU392]